MREMYRYSSMQVHSYADVNDERPISSSTEVGFLFIKIEPDNILEQKYLMALWFCKVLLTDIVALKFTLVKTRPLRKGNR